MIFEISFLALANVLTVWLLVDSIKVEGEVIFTTEKEALTSSSYSPLA